MAKTLNRVQLIGRLGADPEMRNTQAGMTVATFGLATSRQWPGKDGTMQEETEWHNIVVWDKLAQLCGDFLTKGRLVYIEGRIHTRSYDRDGQKQYRTEIAASDMLLLDPKPSGVDGDERDGRASSPASKPAVAARNENERVPAGAGRASHREVEVDPDELPF
jgi:single-strand DNA-binding protein